MTLETHQAAPTGADEKLAVQLPEVPGIAIPSALISRGSRFDSPSKIPENMFAQYEAVPDFPGFSDIYPHLKIFFFKMGRAATAHTCKTGILGAIFCEPETCGENEAKNGAVPVRKHLTKVVIPLSGAGGARVLASRFLGFVLRSIRVSSVFHLWLVPCPGLYLRRDLEPESPSNRQICTNLARNNPP